MTITLRNTKGSELSFTELDGNFTDLDTRIIALPDSAQVATIITEKGITALPHHSDGTGESLSLVTESSLFSWI